MQLINKMKLEMRKDYKLAQTDLNRSKKKKKLQQTDRMSTKTLKIA